MDSDLFARMHEEGAVAVLRSKSAESALEVARACVQGDVHFIEVTFSVPDAASAIAAIGADDSLDAVCGAGTVLSVEQAQSAVDAGARFIVSPVFDAQVAAFCRGCGVPYVPGCMTPTEMHNAQLAGCRLVKFFPSSAFNPSFIKAVHAPMPDLAIMPTGGIDLTNAADWIAAGAFALGVGGNLTTLGADGAEGIVRRAAAYRAQVREGRRR